MKRWLSLPSLLVLVGCCATNPITGRRQMIMISEEQEIALGTNAYQDMLAKVRISCDPAEVEPVRRVAGRIAAVADQVMQERLGHADYHWEFNVVKDDKVVNAFCLPGGKVVVFTGIFPVAHDEAGLAIIIGHEVSHALGRHGAERVSQGMAAQLGAVLLAVSLHDKDEKLLAGALALYGIGLNVGVLLPFSRDHETEADHLGLELAARAGYDPHAGIDVWERMAQLKGGAGGPEFLSTHPSDERRIGNMKEWVPEVLPMYDRSSKPMIAKLPAVGQGQPGYIPPAQVGAAAKGIHNLRMKEGNPALGFEFVLDHDAFVERVELKGPEGLNGSFEPKAVVTAHQPTQYHFYRKSPDDPPLPAGEYQVTLSGRQSGHPFSTTLRYQR